MVITRFNPTTNGPIHLGHAYSLIVNEQYAHAASGQFIVRFDNISSTTKLLSPQRLESITQGQRADIEWLGIRVDEWQWEDRLLPDVIETLSNKDYPRYKDGRRALPYSVRHGNNWIPFPYVPEESAQRVVMDAKAGITHVIRGEEFLTEVSFYSYMCEVFGFPIPEFIFLPRLCGLRGDISKTNGGYTLAELRGCGYTARGVKEMLAKACLEYPHGGWDLRNLKTAPRINL